MRCTTFPRLAYAVRLTFGGRTSALPLILSCYKGSTNRRNIQAKSTYRQNLSTNTQYIKTIIIYTNVKTPGEWGQSPRVQGKP